VFEFNVTAGQQFAFDIDTGGNLDTYVRLYPVVNELLVNPLTPLAANDNGSAPGEAGVNGGDSYLRYTFPSAGRYALVVSHAINGNVDPMRVAGRFFGQQQGGYFLDIKTVDAVAPTVINSGFDVDGNRAWFQFSENVGASLDNADMVLQNVDTGLELPVTAVYDATTNTARFAFDGLSSGLPAGNYRATMLSGSVIDPDGNALAQSSTFSFFALPGDANRDRAVSIADFATLAARFNQPGTFRQGDFNYDETVNIGDFSILASRFNTSLAEPNLPTLARGSQAGREPSGSAADETTAKSIASSLFSDASFI
jgi:hypothetical protein